MLKITRGTRAQEDRAGDRDTPCLIALYRKTDAGDILLYGRPLRENETVSYAEISFRTVGEALRAGDRHFRDRDGKPIPYGLKITTWGRIDGGFEVHWYGRDLRERQAA